MRCLIVLEQGGKTIYGYLKETILVQKKEKKTYLKMTGWVRSAHKFKRIEIGQNIFSVINFPTVPTQFLKRIEWKLLLKLSAIYFCQIWENFYKKY